MQLYLDTDNNPTLAQAYAGKRLRWRVQDAIDIAKLRVAVAAQGVQVAVFLAWGLDEEVVRQLPLDLISEVHIYDNDWKAQTAFRRSIRGRIPTFLALSGAPLESLLHYEQVDGYSLHVTRTEVSEEVENLLALGLPVHIREVELPSQAYTLGHEFSYLRSCDSQFPLQTSYYGVALHPSHLHYSEHVYGVIFPNAVDRISNLYPGITRWNIRVFAGWCRGEKITPAPFL